MRVYRIEVNGTIVNNDLLNFIQALSAIRFWKDLGYQKIKIVDTTIKEK
jgi:hypothetical protein